MRTSKRPSTRIRRGFTLIELLVFIVVVSVGIAGILKVMDTVVRGSADPMVRKQSMALADSLMGEILLKAYSEPGGGANVLEASRDLYNDVDDYNGINETISAAGPVFLDLPSELYGLSVQVAVATVTLGAMPAKSVTVTVGKGGDTVSLTGYRTNY
jgi:MSHA pilin protein MshD